MTLRDTPLVDSTPAPIAVFSGERALWAAFGAVSILCAIEVFVGARLPSTVVLADALHAYAISGCLLVGIAAERPSRNHLHNDDRSERFRWDVFGALVVGLSLMLAVVLIVLVAFAQLRQPAEIAATPYLAVAALSVVVKAVGLRLLIDSRRSGRVVRGRVWPTPVIFFGSLAVAATGILAPVAPWPWVDPLLGVSIAVVLFWASALMTGEAMRALTSVAPDVPTAISNCIHDADEVADSAMAIDPRVRGG